MNSCDSESLPEESRGGEPREEGSIGITSPLPARAVRTPTKAEAKLLYKAVKRETPIAEYYKVAETKKRLDHNPGQAKHDSRRTSGVNTCGSD
ncbi:hypothetical protein Taro_048941 [Colocasia esculenta]|uniref:Uncharacterized protein n=1 Tax=Colocasia esculenta TaxID=4460 RepID=A0A843X9F9_COLES|nr:hypothetical protein [Colocasia esculenta]